ncbi:MAG: flavodoxin reductase [Ignavibacteriales bacterium]|nr:flavodoxin reductase [Ignavibacteriales bacterium]
MKQHFVKIKSIDHITHDVLRIVTEKPLHYTFTSGQATEVSINKKGWQNEKRPFTFTCLPQDDYLEFTIKTYPSHHSVTNELMQLKKDDELILNDVFGTINYKGEGVFIAGGAGVTPFISILRNLHSKNEVGECKLIFANKTQGDIILEQEFKEILGNNFINILSEEKVTGYENGIITMDFLQDNFGGINQYFYLCGPPPMIEFVEKQLQDLNVGEKHLIKEEF